MIDQAKKNVGEDLALENIEKDLDRVAVIDENVDEAVLAHQGINPVHVDASLHFTGMFLHLALNILLHCNTKLCRRLDRFLQIL